MQEISSHTNLPSQLTQDGIRQLFSNHMSNHSQQYILQIIKIIEDYNDNRLCHLSDGSCYITALLTGQARLKNTKGELEVFDVVRISKQDVIILGLQKTPSLELCSINILGMRLLCTIGEPVAYMTYFHNNYVNNKSSISISDGQRIQTTVTIHQLLQNYPHVPSKWILRAKVVRKPDNINAQKPFMIVRLMDQKQNIIEGVFFGQAALEAHRKLVYNHQYLFNNGQIKTKKNSTDQFQIKFSQQSQIIPIQAMKSTTNQNTMINSSSQQQPQLTISDITNNSNGNTNDGKLVTITGKVYKLKNLSKGRSLQVIDKNSDVIEVVLWQQIKDQVKQGITYIFQNLRTKQYRQNVSLQSVRNKTTVKKAPYQIQKQNNNNNALTTQRRFQQKSTPFSRQLKQPLSLSSVSQIVQSNIQTKQYKNICGFLIINTMYMDVKTFFKTQCPNCVGNNQQISPNPLLCRKCSCTTPTIRWNLRCRIIDQKQDIKCTINQELCERLFKMSSIEGFKKIHEDKQYIRRKAEQISHLEGMFRVKVNPSKDTIYYNIVDMYKNDSSVLLKKVYKDLKQSFKKAITTNT